uniref:Uncharacterized protein n=1 Tax=uncultured prokaryote TaxID=198431 RepID=A0A0H5QND5_9ZZZZ|nr:hypothetical protein [uncultured prokaryote]
MTTLYRVQIVHVGHWRGQIKRWNTTFHMTPGPSAPDLAAAVASGYADLQGLGSASVPGGIAEIKVYDAVAGGVPLYSKVYFDYETVGSWIPYTGTFWAATGVTQPTAGEAAAVFTIPAGFSKTGKPVTLRTYWHSFVSLALGTGAVEFSPTVVTAAETQYDKLQAWSDGEGSGLVISAPDGRSVGLHCTLGPYVEAHQRVRGRRRKSVTIDGKKYYPAAGSSAIVPVEAD